MKILELFVKKKKDTLIGIDLTTQDIKIVELKKIENGRFKIEGYSCRQIPPGLVSEDIVIETNQVGQIIKEMISDCKIKTKDVAISVPSNTVISRTISIIGDNDRDIEAEIENSGKKHISLDIEEVDFDFKVDYSNPDSQSKDVLLVACKKRNITTREDTVVISGLEPKIIDSETYVYERIYPVMVDQIKHELSILDKEPNIILMVELFDKKLKVVLLNKGKVTYNEDKYIDKESKGGKTLSGLSLLSDDKEEDSLSYQKGVLNTLSKILKLINSDNKNFISSICFMGDNKHIEDVKNYIEEELQINCLIANPISNMDISDKIDISDLMAKSSLLVVACGLAMRENIYD